MAQQALTGYPRPDGAVGFRNYVLVLPLSGCQMEIARRVALQVPGVTAFAHPNGCDLQGPDFALFGTLLDRAVTHPNVGGVVLLAMGCCSGLSLRLPDKARSAGRLVEVVNARQGTSKVVADAVASARAMQEQLGRVGRSLVSFSDLVLGLKCGASDAVSLGRLNPIVGRACDTLAERGATVVLSEDCELIGCAEELARRATDAAVADGLRRMAREVNDGWRARFGYTFEEFVLRGVSREAWLADSLARAAKAGSGPIRGFFNLGDKARGPGLVVLNAPNTDLESMTSLATSGCNLILFTTGRGTPVGSPLAVTLKVTATRATADKMAENMDLSLADAVANGTSADAAADEVVRGVIEAANGRPTKAELLGHWEVAIPIRGVTY